MAFLASQDFLGVEFDDKFPYILLISYFLCVAQGLLFLFFFLQFFFFFANLSSS